MVISTQVSLDSSSNSLNLLSKTSNSLSNRVLDKTSKESNNFIDNSSSNSKTSNKKDDFKDVLNSRKNLTDEESNKVDNDSYKKNVQDSEESTSAKELKDKLKELKEKAEEEGHDEEDVNDVIKSLLSVLDNLIGLKDNTNLQDENIEVSQPNILIDSISNGSDTSYKLDQLLQALNSEEAKGSLDSETLNVIKDLLSQLSDNSEIKDSKKNSINNILSRLSEMIDDLQNNNGKVLSLEDMLNSSYSQDQNSSLGDSDSNEMSMANKEATKEDKFLNSLVDDKKDNSFDNKINIFASRSQNIQGQNTEVRGLTVNKGTFTEDLIKDVKYMTTNSLKELTVKVNPGNLGEITIKLIQEDGIMKASLKANSKETTALLSQNLAEIKKELSDQNIKISEVNIELYNDDTTYFNGEGFGGSLSQEQGRDERNASLSNSLRNFLSFNDEDEAIENNAEIDATLNFLA